MADGAGRRRHHSAVTATGTPRWLKTAQPRTTHETRTGGDVAQALVLAAKQGMPRSKTPEGANAEGVLGQSVHANQPSKPSTSNRPVADVPDPKVTAAIAGYAGCKKGKSAPLPAPVQDAKPSSPAKPAGRSKADAKRKAHENAPPAEAPPVNKRRRSTEQDTIATAVRYLQIGKQRTANGDAKPVVAIMAPMSVAAVITTTKARHSANEEPRRAQRASKPSKAAKYQPVSPPIEISSSGASDIDNDGRPGLSQQPAPPPVTAEQQQQQRQDGNSHNAHKSTAAGKQKMVAPAAAAPTVAPGSAPSAVAAAITSHAEASPPEDATTPAAPAALAAELTATAVSSEIALEGDRKAATIPAAKKGSRRTKANRRSTKSAPVTTDEDAVIDGHTQDQMHEVHASQRNERGARGKGSAAQTAQAQSPAAVVPIVEPSDSKPPTMMAASQKPPARAQSAANSGTVRVDCPDGAHQAAPAGPMPGDSILAACAPPVQAAPTLQAPNRRRPASAAAEVAVAASQPAAQGRGAPPRPAGRGGGTDDSEVLDDVRGSGSGSGPTAAPAPAPKLLAPSELAVPAGQNPGRAYVALQGHYADLHSMYVALKAQKIGELEGLLDEHDDYMGRVETNINQMAEIWKKEAEKQQKLARAANAPETMQRLAALEEETLSLQAKLHERAAQAALSQQDAVQLRAENQLLRKEVEAATVAAQQAAAAAEQAVSVALDRERAAAAGAAQQQQQQQLAEAQAAAALAQQQLQMALDRALAAEAAGKWGRPVELSLSPEAVGRQRSSSPLGGGLGLEQCKDGGFSQDPPSAATTPGLAGAASCAVALQFPTPHLSPAGVGCQFPTPALTSAPLQSPGVACQFPTPAPPSLASPPAAAPVPSPGVACQFPTPRAAPQSSSVQLECSETLGSLPGLTPAVSGLTALAQGLQPGFESNAQAPSMGGALRTSAIKGLSRFAPGRLTERPLTLQFTQATAHASFGAAGPAGSSTTAPAQARFGSPVDAPEGTTDVAAHMHMHHGEGDAAVAMAMELGTDTMACVAEALNLAKGLIPEGVTEAEVAVTTVTANTSTQPGAAGRPRLNIPVGGRSVGTALASHPAPVVQGQGNGQEPDQGVHQQLTTAAGMPLPSSPVPTLCQPARAAAEPRPPTPAASMQQQASPVAAPQVKLAIPAQVPPVPDCQLSPSAVLDMRRLPAAAQRSSLEQGPPLRQPHFSDGGSSQRSPPSPPHFPLSTHMLRTPPQGTSSLQEALLRVVRTQATAMQQEAAVGNVASGGARAVAAAPAADAVAAGGATSPRYSNQISCNMPSSLAGLVVGTAAAAAMAAAATARAQLPQGSGSVQDDYLPPAMQEPGHRVAAQQVSVHQGEAGAGADVTAEMYEAMFGFTARSVASPPGTVLWTHKASGFAFQLGPSGGELEEDPELREELADGASSGAPVETGSRLWHYHPVELGGVAIPPYLKEDIWIDSKQQSALIAKVYSALQSAVASKRKGQ